MSFETYIARRYFSSGRYFVSVATWITIIGVALGVGVVCFVMSMHNGFEREIRNRLLGTTAHISVFPLSNEYIQDYWGLVERIEEIDHVVAASPFVYYKAAVSSASTGDGIIVRGIDLAAESRTADIENSIVIGEYSFDGVDYEGNPEPGIIIGEGLADRLSVFVGDPLVLYSLSGEELRKNVRPRVSKFHVTGIFESGMYEFDGQMAYIDIESAQDLFKTGGGATAVHLKLEDIYLAENVAPVIDSALGFRYDVVPWYVLHQNLFSWIALEKLVLFIGFSLIVLVAAFSIISTLVMLTMQKRAEIGILKTIGSTPWEIRKIFVLKGLMIAVAGVAAGWLLALTAGWVQNQWQVVSLPPDIYFISYLPIDAQFFDFFLAGAVTVVVCFFAALYPADRASRLSVIEVLRQ
ncbi:FtsX-like permease family protein [candidate division GN15 bacterium]|nr:FtsX-like permease family protein [candidate division GN15 bacterium]